MQLKLSELEVEILRKLVNGEAVSVSSQQRVRLELAGLIREGAAGIAVTAAGKSLALQERENATANDVALDAKVARDRRGRRLPFQRKSIF
jgi:hypothetical protein